MPDLAFEVLGATAACDAAIPTIALRVEVSNRTAAETIHSVVLRCRINVEAARRRYAGEEQRRLADLFGEPERWGQTLGPLLWAQVTTTVPAFAASATFEVPAPCTFDFNVAATKYFYGLEEGTVPLSLLFNGTVLYQSAADRLQAAPIPWSTESRFALPLAVWKEAIRLHYPNTAWLRLRRDVFDRLYACKVRQGVATFEEALERLLGSAPEVDA